MTLHSPGFPSLGLRHFDRLKVTTASKQEAKKKTRQPARLDSAE
jgi:hypothetical protein